MLDARLAPVAVASRPLASSFPAPGRVEHDPGQILAGVLGAIGDALAQAGADWAAVAGLGLAGQTETFMVWDRATGQPAYPAISWRDTRTAGACRQLRADGCEPEIRTRTGLPLEPAFSASKLRWLLAEIPGARAAAARGQLLFGDVNCWLIWQLSGGAVHATDPSMAARTMLFNLSSGDWDPVLLELFGIPAPMLPAIAPTAGPFGGTEARVCGGRAAITASAGDQQAGLFGQRCWRAGLAKLTLGTGAFLWCHAGSSPPACPPAGVVASCAWQLGSQTSYALEGFVPNAGGVITWLRQLGVLAPDAWPQIAAGALSRPPGGAWCVPALFGLGTPHWAPAATAEIGGLTADSTGADVAEAALIGVVHQIVDAIDAVQGGLAAGTRPGRRRPGPQRLRAAGHRRSVWPAPGPSGRRRGDRAGRGRAGGPGRRAVGPRRAGRPARRARSPGSPRAAGPSQAGGPGRLAVGTGPFGQRAGGPPAAR